MKRQRRDEEKQARLEALLAKLPPDATGPCSTVHCASEKAQQPLAFAATYWQVGRDVQSDAHAALRWVWDRDERRKGRTEGKLVPGTLGAALQMAVRRTETAVERCAYSQGSS